MPDPTTPHASPMHPNNYPHIAPPTHPELDTLQDPVVYTAAELDWLNTTLTMVMKLARQWDDRTDSDIANAVLNKTRQAMVF